MMNAIDVKNVSKSYGKVQALSDVSFAVAKGEVFGLIGPDGAGKTSMFRILCSLLLPETGMASVDGFDVVKQMREVRCRVGYMPGKFSLYQDLTIEENLNFFATLFGTTVEEGYDSIKAIYSQIERFKDRKAGALSGGMKQKLALSCALVHQPSVLFLDEPTTGLDPKSRKLVWDYINYLRKEHRMTIFLTTHYMEETRDADHVVILDKGHIVSTGTPAELKSRYAHSKLVWYTPASDRAETVIAKISNKFVYDADHYNIETDQNLTEFIFEHREEIRDYEYIKGTMDDVFLNLTGKELA
jgi:ABC-2 type transport system ATP-binding protein